MKHMRDRIFLDTNILIYAYSEDEKQKQKIALALIDKYSQNIIISTQVINELTNILFKKFKIDASTIKKTILELDSVFMIEPFDLATQIKAVHIKEKYKLQFYDSLILATALENRCTILFSEDMQNGQVIENTLTIINPFKTKTKSF